MISRAECWHIPFALLVACAPVATPYRVTACRAPWCIPKSSLTPLAYRARTALVDGSEVPDAAIYASSEPVWYTRSVIVSQTPGGILALSPRYATWHTIRWEISQEFLIARATTDETGAPLAAADQPAAFIFRVAHTDPQRVPICGPFGPEVLDCPGAASLPPWTNLPAVMLDLSQSYAADSHVVDRAGAILVTEPVPIYINTRDNPNAPVAHCATGICGDLNDASQQLTDFSVTLRWVTEPSVTTPATEATVRTVFALTPQ